MSTTANELTARRGLAANATAAESTLPAVARLFHALMKRLDTGTLHFTSPEGVTTHFVGPHDGPVADIRFDDWAVATAVFKSAEIGLAECYRDGRLHSSDLTAFLTLCALNQRALESVFYGKPLVALLFRIKHMLRANTRANARKNIHAHYDLSNDFYGHWLDETMSYSSAVFGGDFSQPMAAAQTAKYERILKVLDPQPGQTILEIGCGWGGFAEHAARTRGVHVTGITLSNAQLQYARQRIADAGLAPLVDLQLIDYRDIRGQFDHVVSIEMFEAVGERFWPVYFRSLNDRLKPGGRAVVQAITIAEEAFARYRETSDFIREYIFPGGMLAPIPRFIAEASAAGLAAGEPFRFGLDYAETLKWWRHRVNESVGMIKPLGFDDRFLQLWRFYLCYCEAGFRTGRTDVMQIELVKPA
jgi:cyclopropane-fatty-acyl-phospholipid synthase